MCYKDPCGGSQGRWISNLSLELFLWHISEFPPQGGLIFVDAVLSRRLWLLCGRVGRLHNLGTLASGISLRPCCLWHALQQLARPPLRQHPDLVHFAFEIVIIGLPGICSNCCRSVPTKNVARWPVDRSKFGLD
jgi:hypothetical protein